MMSNDGRPNVWLVSSNIFHRWPRAQSQPETAELPQRWPPAVQGGGARQGRVVRIFDVIIIKIATYIYIIYINIIKYMHNV